MPYYEYEYNHHEFLRITGERIKRAMYPKIGDLSAEAWVTPEPVPFDKRQAGSHLVLKEGDRWGSLWDCAWFHLTGKIPAEAAGKKVILRIDLCGEGLVTRADGTPIKGITTVRSRNVPALGNFGKSVVILADQAAGGEPVDLWVDAGCNDLFGAYQGGLLSEAHLAVCNEELRALYYDYAVLFELMESLPEQRARRHRLLHALTDAARIMQDYTEEEAAEARRVLAPMLQTRADDDGFVLSCVGHAHLDLAWTWPIRETIRKGARTFSTAADHIDRYPEYIFSASQAQLYEWMRLSYPAVWERVQEKVKSGNWEITGGMWVESDLNVTSGESLVRQFLYGQKYFEKHFGVRCQVGWIPDSFGFTGALPQIMKKAGIQYFLTQKPRTSPNIIHYPHDVFWWEGIDGTRILTHFAPGTSYSSSAAPVDLLRTEERFHDKYSAPACIVLFGQGDGGGGAGAECLESLRRVRSISGMPEVIPEPSQKLFERLESCAGEYKIWRGPMDLDMHTGTFTTSHRSKQYNREMENSFRETELLAAMASVRGVPYPYAELEELWHEMLLYQFHDILPGTSIRRVYEESWPRYQEMLAKLAKLREERLPVLCGKQGKQVINTLSWERTEALTLDGKPVLVKARSMGITPLEEAVCPLDTSCLRCGPDFIENDLLLVRFGENGWIARLWDKERSCEMLEPDQPSNQLAVYEDRLDYNEDWGIENAWDFPIRYADKAPEYPVCTGMSTEISGAEVRCCLTFSYHHSEIRQTVRLVPGGRRLDFDTTVDWKEHERFLRTKFRPAFHPGWITRGTQFGMIRQSNDRNTTWDFARFEVCGQRFLDASMENEGLALMSSFKYGYRIQEGMLDLALLRSSGSPAEDIDVGTHHFVYALYPHAGDCVQAEVFRRAMELDSPLHFAESAGTGSETGSFAAENVLIEAVKAAEDGDGIIVRFYEQNGVRTNAALHLPQKATAVWETNLLEEPIGELPAGQTVERSISPFEIVTLKMKF